MAGFSADWLALRESFDHHARDQRLARRFAAMVSPGDTLVDLGCGTGSNHRALAPLIQGARWRLVDHDPALLAHAAATGAETRAADLARDVEAVVDDADAVTAAALIDLVSAAWIERLCAAAARHDAPMLIVLTVDGRHEFDPRAPEDDDVMARFARDQQRDKGFGPSLGAGAVEALTRAARKHGYAVETAPSDWIIAADDRAMMTATIAGIAAAANAPEWGAARTASLRRLVVGHTDVLAYPRRA